MEDLYLPVFLIGVGLMILAMVKARERVRAIRTVGVTLAVAGGLLLGVGLATPAFAAVAAHRYRTRCAATRSPLHPVLVGRLIGAGQRSSSSVSRLALAPGHDGGDLRDRVARVRAWFAEKRTAPAVAVRRRRRARWSWPLAAVTMPLELLRTGRARRRGPRALRRRRRLPPRARASWSPTTRSRGSTSARSSACSPRWASPRRSPRSSPSGSWRSNTSEPRANPSNQGCNGYIELCAQPLNQIVWPASHNAMSSAAYNFLGAEHTITIPEQLNAGARFLMIDAYYGYDDNGLVRTNLAGGVNREELRKERGEESVRELDRLGALTGVADTSGKKQDLYFCHDFCELGAIPAEQVFADIDAFLSRNLTDVVVIDIEDYVQPKDLKQALIDDGLWDRVWKPSPKQIGWPTLARHGGPRRRRPRRSWASDRAGSS